MAAAALRRIYRLRLALVTLAATCALVVGAGAVFAPAASAVPDAGQIDAYLALHSSPLTGLGAAFVADGAAFGVDPAFLVAITGAETSFGLYLYWQDGDQSTFNAFNWFYGPTWPASDFASWEEAIAGVSQGLAGELYYGAGLYSVSAIAPRYCPDGTEAWVNNVTAFMLELGGDPNDTRLIAAQAEPPVVAPALAALDGSVKLGPGAREVGRRMRVTFTIVNRGGEALSLEGVRLAVYEPSGATADLVSDQAFTLAPGRALRVSAAWPLDQAGTWRGWIEVRHDGTTSRVGPAEAFSFLVVPPRSVELRTQALRDRPQAGH